MVQEEERPDNKVFLYSQMQPIHVGPICNVGLCQNHGNRLDPAVRVGLHNLQ